MSDAAGPMAGRIAALYRHPVKGFTPEPLNAVRLVAGAVFPGDRLYAVERGESGFDPASPRHVSKQRFAVLANYPALVRATTAYDEASSVLQVRCEGLPVLSADLSQEGGRSAFADYLQVLLGEDEPQRLRVLRAPDGFRFTDSSNGYVSILNLESVRDLERRLERPVDPLRFRANVHVEGWPAWRELDLAAGTDLGLGAAWCTVIEPIVRCIATHVDPKTGVRDIDMLGALRRHYGHLFCGLYLRVLEGGEVHVGDPLPLPAIPEPAA